MGPIEALASLGISLEFLERPAWQFWILATVLLLILEVFTSGFVLLALAPGTLFGAWAAGVGGGSTAQIAAFTAGVLVGMIWIRPFFLNRALTRGDPTNIDAVLGQKGTVVETIPPGGVGRVKLRFEDWRATADEELEQGAAIEVTGVEGSTLRVRRARGTEDGST